MRLVFRALLLVLLAPGIANAQDIDAISIRVGGYQLTTNGAEKDAGVSRGVHLRWSMGKPTIAVFSMVGCGDFAVTVPPASFSDNAHAGWRVEITPTKVAADHAVTFRLRWVRALDTGKGFTPAIEEDLELTLKPGESRPLDSAPVPATARTSDGKPCLVKAGSLRLSVEFESFDRRLIGADVWLVERLPNGKEDSQLQSVRGIPHQKIPFYFDSLTDGKDRFDMFGHLVAELKDGAILIEVEAVSARPDPGQYGYQAAFWYRSTIRVRPGEIVEVELTPRDKRDIANRNLSLRIRPRQIR